MSHSEKKALNVEGWQDSLKEKVDKLAAAFDVSEERKRQEPDYLKYLPQGRIPTSAQKVFIGKGKK